MKPIIALLWAALALPLAAADSAKVTGTIVVPKTVKAFSGLELEIRLYEFHPFIADKPADLVGKFNRKNFGHQAGKETRAPFIVGDAATIKQGMSYYVTCFVIDAKGNRKLMGKKKDNSFLCELLTNGKPNKVTLFLRDLRK